MSTKVYTKQGDTGTTQLIGGERVSKADLRVEAYGSVDELSAFTALLADMMTRREVLPQSPDALRRITARLMDVEALMAQGSGNTSRVAPLNPAEVEWLESQIDLMQSHLPQITKFTIPGGDEITSMCHVCRTVCRRAERAAVRAAEQYPLDAAALRYLNRLSDYFYLLGRQITDELKISEILWTPSK